MEQRLIVRVFLVLVLSRGSKLSLFEHFMEFIGCHREFVMILSQKRLLYFALGNVEI